jgi:hypothetical protein
MTPLIPKLEGLLHAEERLREQGESELITQAMQAKGVK